MLLNLPISPESASPDAPRLPKPDRTVEYFLLFEIICQVALLVPSIGAVRPLMRVGAFGGSLYMLTMLAGAGRRHPAAKPVILALGIICASLFRDTTTTWIVGLAAVLLNVAIVAPLFWVPRLHVDYATLRRALLILWTFHTLSSVIGILQVYFPGQFQPELTTVLWGIRSDYLKSLMIETNGGQSVFRPMGLTDNPGGAGLSGFYVVLLGLTFLASERRRWFVMAFVAAMAVGLAAIALSQQRSVLLMLLVGMGTFLGLLSVRNVRLLGRRTRFGQAIEKVGVTMLLAVLCGVFLLGFELATSLASKSVSERLHSLVGDNASDVYYSNRGLFLDETVNELLPVYPFGAGLGRWGMVNRYFGDNSNLQVPALWVEIQWTGWLFDGGVPLILAYATALLMALSVAVKIALGRYPSELGVCAVLLVAYNVGAVAETFDCPFFIGQGGLEFWFLNALLYAAAREFESRGRRQRVR